MERTYAITGMTCSHCVAAVTKELEAVAGVDAVDVSLDRGAATVVGDVDDAAVVAAVAEAGYEAVAQP
ncbi:MAG: heavy-metal-associated domain-containing protein [Actinomycetota bacterium]|nr:heavy-metal-associated domain-containing protein [Actinomycetota bacterium]